MALRTCLYILICLGPLFSSPAFSEPSFTVKSYKTKHATPHGIQLIFPPHRSTLTEGYVFFSWAHQDQNKYPKVKLVVEKISINKKVQIESRQERVSMYCTPGKYRWRVSKVGAHTDSRWRTFNVVLLKGQTIANKRKPVLRTVSGKKILPTTSTQAKSINPSQKYIGNGDRQTKIPN